VTAGAGIYSDASKEGYDTICAMVASLKQHPGKAFTQIPYACESPPRVQCGKANMPTSSSSQAEFRCNTLARSSTVTTARKDAKKSYSPSSHKNYS
jgi:hypothetical protein